MLAGIRHTDTLFSLPSRTSEGHSTPYNVNSSLVSSFPQSPTRPALLKEGQPGAEAGTGSSVIEGGASPPPMILRRVGGDGVFSLPSRGTHNDPGVHYDINTSLVGSFPTSPTRPRRLRTIAEGGDSSGHDSPPAAVVATGRAPQPHMVLRRVASDGLFSVPTRDNDRKTPFNVNTSLVESFPTSPTRPRRLKTISEAISEHARASKVEGTYVVTSADSASGALLQPPPRSECHRSSLSPS